MPRAPVKKKPAPPSPAALVPTQFRFPPELLSALDAWLADANRTRRGPALTRTDLVRGVLQWAADTRPDWEATPRP